MSVPGSARVLLMAALVGGMAPARAVADDGACPPTRGNARARDTAAITLRLTLRWRAGDPAGAASAALDPANVTTTQATAGQASVAGGGTVGVTPSTTTSTRSVAAPAHRLPDPVALSTVNGQALSWSLTMLRNEPTWQAVWTAQGPAWVGGERPVAVVDHAWFCPHWPGGSNAVTVGFRISSDPLPAGDDASEVPRGWSRHGQVRAPLGAWVPLSPQSGGLADARRGQDTVSAGRRIATDGWGPAVPVLEMRWSLEAAGAAVAPAARPRLSARPQLSLRPDRNR